MDEGGGTMEEKMAYRAKRDQGPEGEIARRKLNQLKQARLEAEGRTFKRRAGKAFSGIAAKVGGLFKKRPIAKAAGMLMSARDELNLILFGKQGEVMEHEPPSITGKNMAKLIAGGAAFTGGGMALQALIAKIKSMRKLSARDQLNEILFARKDSPRFLKKKPKGKKQSKKQQAGEDEQHCLSTREELDWIVRFGEAGLLSRGIRFIGRGLNKLGIRPNPGPLPRIAQIPGQTLGTERAYRAAKQSASDHPLNSHLDPSIKPPEPPGMSYYPDPDEMTARNGPRRFSAREELDTILFGIFSPGTAKRVFRGLAEGAERSPLVRPGAMGMGPAFITRNTPAEHVGMISSMYEHPGVKPGVTVVPRLSPEAQADASAMLPEGARSIFKDPVAIAAHERGHAYDPGIEARQANQLSLVNDMQNKGAKALEGGADPMGPAHPAWGETKQIGKKIAAGMLQHETIANQRVLGQVQQHGTSDEVNAWKKYANNQMKVGYRKPMFDAGTAGQSLSEKKDFLRDNPYLRRQATSLEARSCALFFNTSNPAAASRRDELKAIINFGTDPRPRNSLGEFGSDEPGQPHPGAMRITYGQAAVGGAAAGAGFAGGSAALRAVIERIKKAKK